MTDNNILADALAKGTFSVLEVAKGRGYPQDIVDVYTDYDAAFRVHRLEQQIASEKDAEKVNVLDEQKAELIEKIKGSVLTFHLRGISEGVIKAIQAQATEKFGEEESADKGRWTNFSYLANHIVSVTNAEGAVDGHRWTVEEVFDLHDDLPAESFQKLHELMIELSFATTYFNEAVSADF